MPDKDDKRKPASRSIDFSTGKKGKKKVTDGMAAPVVQETIDLSTPKEEKQEQAPASEKPKQPRSKRKPSKDKSSRKPAPAKAGGKSRSGASLAELVDPETLARLKGERANKDVDS